MGIRRKLLFALTGRLRLRIISEDGQPYLERYHLGSAFGWRFYIHRFVGSDPDRGIHDHPWPWAVSVRLVGRYMEYRRTGLQRQHLIGVFTGETFHRVVLEPGQRPAWTLFGHRDKQVKRWGFWREYSEPGPHAVFTPYVYEDGAERSGRWWETAPIGWDEPRRAPVSREAAR